MSYVLKSSCYIAILFLFINKVLGVDANPGTGITHRIRQGFPALVDCNIDISNSPTSLLAYTWTRNSIDVTLDSRFTTLISGSMFIRTTKKKDAGIYECVARTLADDVLPKVYRGVKVNLDILYPPAIILTKDTVTVPLGGDIYLPCSSQGNPSLISTKWLWNDSRLPQIFQHIIFSNGTLHMKNAQKNYEGTFSCTPFNEVGLGKSAQTALKVEVLPVFTMVPPKTLSVKLGDSLELVCKATDSQMNWRKVNSTLPGFRSKSRGGTLLIHNIQLEDSGIYECKAISITSSLSKFVDLLVISTPMPPVITNVATFSTSALLSWKPGYNGGSRQVMEIWYRPTNSDDYRWRSITRISSHVTSYTLYDLEPRVPYMFSLRGVNDAGYGLFSNIYYVETATLSSDYRAKDTKVLEKPLAPSDLRVNITEDGILMSWSYSQTPGRPQAQFFIVEYREINSSSTWKAVGEPITWDRRQYFIANIKLHLNVVYELRMFSFGGQFSEPSRVVEANLLASVSTHPSNSTSDSDVIIIIVCIISVVFFTSFVVFIFCFGIKRKSKKKLTRTTKIKRKNKFKSSYSSRESNLSDSESDSCELNDVKLLPNLSPFVAEKQKGSGHAYFKKLRRTKYDHGQSLTLGDEHVARVIAASSTDAILSTRCKKASDGQDILPEHYTQSSREVMPTAFQSGRLLPEYPELRDSYDQFCTTLSEYSSQEELEAKCSMKDLDIVFNDKIDSAGSRDFSKGSPDNLLDSVYLCKRRKKTILEEASGAHDKYQRWSMPEFTKLWYATSDSDTESTITEQTDKDQHFLSYDQFNEALEKPVVVSQTGSACRDNISPQHQVNPTWKTVKYEEEITAAKNIGFVVRESVSCPAIISVESPASLYETSYNSSGFSEECNFSVSPPPAARSHVLINTGSENGHHAGKELYLEDDLVYAKDSDKFNENILETNPSICEVSVCESDSGYSGLSNGTRGSPEYEEPDDYDTLGEKKLDILHNPELFETLKHLQEKLDSRCDSDGDNGISRGNLDFKSDSQRTEQNISVCDTSSCKLHVFPFPDVTVEKQISGGMKDKRCAQLMEEFRFNKNSLNPRTTRNSLYRTSEV